MVAVERGKQHFSSPLTAVFAHPPSSSTTLHLITSQGWDSHKLPQNSDMGMEWICGIWYLNLWNHYNLGNACSCFFSCLQLANISYSSFWETKPYASLPYQSNQGYQAIPIWLQWGILTVFHIFLEQLGTVITQLSPETTHEMGSSCVRQKQGPCCDKKRQAFSKEDMVLWYYSEVRLIAAGSKSYRLAWHHQKLAHVPVGQPLLRLWSVGKHHGAY